MVERSVDAAGAVSSSDTHTDTERELHHRRGAKQAGPAEQAEPQGARGGERREAEGGERQTATGEQEVQLNAWVTAKRKRDYATADRIHRELMQVGVRAEEHRPRPQTAPRGGGGWWGWRGSWEGKGEWVGGGVERWEFEEVRR